MFSKTINQIVNQNHLQPRVFHKIKNVPSSKISQVREGGGSQNLGTVPKLYLVINYDGFPYVNAIFKDYILEICFIIHRFHMDNI